MPLTPDELHAQCRSRRFIIAGPCVLESLELAMRAANQLAETSDYLGLPLLFKSSFDKANRTSVKSYRGPGMDRGLEWLARIKRETGLPVVTDIHLPEQAAPVAEVADVLQIPAFLCRQTDLLAAAAHTGRVVNIKKGQFVAPWDMRHAVNKVRESGNERIWLTERGSSFGYNNLVVDFRSLDILGSLGCPVVFDATHSVQLPGGGDGCSAGERKYVPLLARAAAAAGAQGVFLEVHPDPDKALCDGPNSWPLDLVEPLLTDLAAIWSLKHAC
jgi:2-dehydro-3-deoxyphosphooctonate aldolase (KDO 8-P synthase)